MKQSAIRTMLFAFGVVTSISLIPNVASAKGSVRIDLPSISIGVNDRYSRNSYYNKQYNNRYNNRYKSNRYYSQKYRSNSKSYRQSNQYYNQPSRRSYSSNYQSEYCPTVGYSNYYYEDRGCYQHGNHYHCD